MYILDSETGLSSISPAIDPTVSRSASKHMIQPFNFHHLLTI